MAGAGRPGRRPAVRSAGRPRASGSAGDPVRTSARPLALPSWSRAVRVGSVVRPHTVNSGFWVPSYRQLWFSGRGRRNWSRSGAEAASERNRNTQTRPETAVPLASGAQKLLCATGRPRRAPKTANQGSERPARAALPPDRQAPKPASRQVRRLRRPLRLVRWVGRPGRAFPTSPRGYRRPRPCR